jgi:hypothetical protein
MIPYLDEQRVALRNLQPLPGFLGDGDQEIVSHPDPHGHDDPPSLPA